MNISYKWLKELIDIDLDPETLAEKLTLVGLELDGMRTVGDDHIFDIEVTSNRGDCLSHLGVAREISAFSNKDIRFPESLADEPHVEPTDLVRIEDPDLCRRFTARTIKNVNIGPSPAWLVKRLEAIGERSINNVADITNYVMHELGQPMHAFDLRKLAGNSIVVRRAKSGETITTLDEIERKLNSSMLMICDQEKPVAVGGVMGGLDSGITEETSEVLLEVAYFKRDSIRQTSRDLNLSSEASYHFERGVDIDNLTRASNRAARLICELAAGTAEDFVDVYPVSVEPIDIAAPNLTSEVTRLSGLEVGEDEIRRILNRLGLETSDNKTFRVPTWRHDMTIDEDLVEEVVRIHGYDRVGEELPSALSSGEYQPNETRKRNLRRALTNMGFDEALSYSFIDERHDSIFDFVPSLMDSEASEKFISIKDPIIEGSTRMRPSLISGLLDAVKVNFNHQNRNVKLFEIGKVFAKSHNEKGLPTEQELMGIVITGNETHANKAFMTRPLDFFDIKGAVETTLTTANARPFDYKAVRVRHLQEGQSAELVFAGNTVGFVGRLSDEIISSYKFKQPVYVAEFDLETVLESGEVPSNYVPLPLFPGISRDISLIAERNISYATIESEIRQMGFELCRNVEFVDVFEGKGMKDNERSITIRLEYRSNERTLTEEEVEKVHHSILDNLGVNLGIKQR